MVSRFQSVTNNLFCQTFPQKEITVSPEDQPWFNEQLRKLKRLRLKEYSRHGHSEKYNEIRIKFEVMSKAAIKKYKNKIDIEVTEGKRGRSYPALKRIGLRPGEQTQSAFQLPNHAELNLTSAQSAELIAEHFSSISQEYAPLDVSSLPPNVQTFLLNNDQRLAPTLTSQDIHYRIIKAKKPNGLVPGDLPKKIVQQCASSLSVPLTIIFNRITQYAEYPAQWKIEHQIALPKSYPPESEDQLRNLAKTPFYSKLYEAFVGGWLVPIIKPYLDPGQCGLKGFSITHYLVKLLHFVHTTLDLRKPHAVLAACVDLSKAFNRVDHTLVIQDLYDMHTPAWLLHIVISYLTNRSMYLTYNGEKSTQKRLPGGGPQGAYLGGLIFIVKFNGAFLRPPVPRYVFGPVTKAKAEKVKFVDDGTVAVSIDLKVSVVQDPVDRPKPRNFHERTGHILPEKDNLLHYYLRDTEQFALDNKMIINKQKTKLISFTKSRKWDFPPELHFSDGSPIECVQDIKLVGVVVCQSLKWSKNTEYICEKARQKLWLLRRMLKLDLTIFQMFDVYAKEIRSILELAVPVWHAGLTKGQAADIERIQKVALQIILQDKYVNYQFACKTLSAETLENRRLKLCSTFATRNYKSDNCLFTRIGSNVQTRNKSNIVKEYKCNNGRYQKSSLPFLAKLLNANHKK